MSIPADDLAAAIQAELDAYPSYNPNNGGQTPSYFSGNTGLDTIPFGGALESSYISTSNYICNSAQDPMCCFNPFENIRILGAGANSEVIVNSAITSSTFYSRPAGLSDDGIGGGTESHGYTGIIIAGDATDNGCGGGAACGVQLTSITSGKGGDGAVKIYVRGATI